MFKFSPRFQKIQSVLYSGSIHPPPASYRLKQIEEAIYQQAVSKYEEITVLPLRVRQALSSRLGSVSTLKVVKVDKSTQVTKVQFQTNDSLLIETVRSIFKPVGKDRKGQRKWSSICLSSQAGCAMGCKFCATGANGLKRNLTVDEIVDQVLYFKQRKLPIDNLAFMGMGEPLMNLENLLGVLEIITSKQGLGISPRRVSVSTVGVIPGLKILIKEFPQINISYSLHSPFSGERLQLIPAEKVYPLKEVLKVLDQYIKSYRRKVVLAYLLLDGVNDSKKYAQALVELIKNRGKNSYLYHVVLIRYNQAKALGEFKASSPPKVKAFQEILKRNQISHSYRQSFGQEIGAGCGQLSPISPPNWGKPRF